MGHLLNGFIIKCIGFLLPFDLKGDGLASKSLDKDLHCGYYEKMDVDEYNMDGCIVVIDG